MADVNRGNRPLSPHIQVYKLPITAITSIMTRITGHAMLAGILLLTWWLVAAVSSPWSFALANSVMLSWFGFLVMWGSVWSLWFHMLAGLRHLTYDSGFALELHQANLFSRVLIIGSVVLTVITMLLFYLA